MLLLVILHIYFVSFLDKPEKSVPQLSPRAVEQRERWNIPTDEKDYPVSPLYLGELQKAGVYVHHVSRWFNGATVEMDEETAEKLKSYEGLSIRAKELIREKKELEDRFNKRFSESKDLEESKKRVLKSLQTILENAGEKSYRAIEAGEAENNYSKLRLKIPAIIEDMGKSIEALFKRKS
jgi:hypothetical protein